MIMYAIPSRRRSQNTTLTADSETDYEKNKQAISYRLRIRNSYTDSVLRFCRCEQLCLTVDRTRTVCTYTYVRIHHLAGRIYVRRAEDEEGA